ncbi:integrin alpha pat-2-like [Manduca sexta]|uniref:integrin alpha pat-2-like n=1 Tax=Manduca sexta TaxID=7130 RepID=UPI00188FC75F|nr:integrin alpha pat-2-like [Manduca sexta]
MQSSEFPLKCYDNKRKVIEARARAHPLPRRPRCILAARSRILVGAPEDERYPPKHYNISRPGAVYRCEPGRRSYSSEGHGQRALERCAEMVFDRTNMNLVDKQGRQIEEKSHQWFGATLTSTGRNGPIVACAPRYVSYVSAKMNQRDPVGTCYVAKTSNAATTTEFSPCRTWHYSLDEASHGQRKTGVCQAGFSASISKVRCIYHFLI